MKFNFQEKEDNMNQAEYEHMMKVYSYISSSPPNSPQREKRLAEIGEEDSSKLWDFYVGLCSGRIKKPETINKESEAGNMTYQEWKVVATRNFWRNQGEISNFERQNPTMAREYKKRLENERKKRSEIMAIKDTAERHRKIAENMALFGR